MKRIPVAMNAARVVHAISRIGYSSWSALMDIIDNSVTASATNVHVIIEKHDGKFVQDKYSTKSYTIVDNGIGMDNQGIQNALMLGSISDYPDMSLSKYGMGLKSAGLSLGTKIRVISKQNSKFTNMYSIDVEMIENEYFIVEESLTTEEESYYNELLNKSIHGSIIEITGCEKVENYSIKTTVKHLLNKMGVVYYEFLNADTPLKITIFDSIEDKQVEAKDILFWNEAYNTYDHENYDFKKPCKVINQNIPIAVKINDVDTVKNAQLQVVLFPQDGMAGNPNFTENERNRIKSYEIGSENSGFFIYRNNRLIRWGEHFPSVTNSRMRGFRAKLHIFTEHDDVLHVDVSKQNLHISEDIMVQIKNIIRPALKMHNEIFDKCNALLKNNHSEGEMASERLEEFSPIDPDEILNIVTEEENKERQKRRTKLSEKEVEDEISIPEQQIKQDENIIHQKQDEFQKVRYSYRVKADYLWRLYLDVNNGHYIVINQNHVFYEDVIAKFPEQSPARQAIEFLLFSSALAEGLTVEHLMEDDAIIEKVLDKYARVMSSNLSALINDNRDLFE